MFFFPLRVLVPYCFLPVVPFFHQGSTPFPFIWVSNDPTLSRPVFSGDPSSSDPLFSRVSDPAPFGYLFFSSIAPPGFLPSTLFHRFVGRAPLVKGFPLLLFCFVFFTSWYGIVVQRNFTARLEAILFWAHTA